MTPLPTAPTPRRAHRLPALAALALGTSALLAAPSERPGRSGSLDAERVLGPAACAECHTEEFEVWRESRHEANSRLLTRNAKAQKIARDLGITRLKNDARCTSCHFTVAALESSAARAVAGVSCESCHGGARDWLELHDDFGKAEVTARTESEDHRAERLARCDEAGMIHPLETHRIADQCFACHTVADEELVGVGHPTGAGFELLTWSQGEIRHNFVRGGGKRNETETTGGRRLLYLIGQMLELKHAVLALADASGPGAYADAMRTRAEGALERLRQLTAAAGGVMEIDLVLESLRDRTLEPGMDPAVPVETIDACAGKLQRNGGAKGLDRIDALVPGEDADVGAPAR